MLLLMLSIFMLPTADFAYAGLSQSTIAVEDQLCGATKTKWQIFLENEPIAQGTVWQTLFRQAEIFTTMIVGGWLFFRYVIWGKAQVPLNPGNRFSRFSLRGLLLAAFIIYLVAGIGDIWIRVADFSVRDTGNTNFIQAFQQIASGTIIGMVSWLRPLLVIGLFFYVSVKQSPNLLWISIVVIVLLLTFPLTGHAALSGTVISNTVHLLMGTAWFGGLLGFTVYSFSLKKDLESLRLIYDRLTVFSTLALIAVLLAAFTGAVMGVTYLWGKMEPVNPVYTMMLFWKIVLFAGAVMVAALHRFVWLPRLKKLELHLDYVFTVQEVEEAGGKHLRRLFMGLRVELLLITAITVLSVFLSTVSPGI